MSMPMAVPCPTWEVWLETDWR